MVKHQSKSDRAETDQLTSIANDWHKCERFWMKGVECPFRTANIEEDDDNQPEGQRDPRLLLIPPERRRKLQTNLTDISADAKTFDVRDFIPLPIPEPALPEGPRPERPIPGPHPGLPRPKVPVPLNIDRLPDGMPAINPSNAPNPADIGGLIRWLNNQFIKGLANKPDFSRSPLTSPLRKNLNMPAPQLDSFLLRESSQQAASAEATFAKQSAQSMKPVSDIERSVNQSSSTSKENKGVTKRQIVGAGAAVAAGAAAAIAAGGRRGGGGGFQFPSRFPPDPVRAR